ncbi:cell wall-binding repeat-containing protein [Catenulispora subtropica]|uniref:Pyrrolo-quinoline quinone n=1 Tax=Catenulispora subtropica TaxID=450798 RepID=A0ABN2S5L9_9ACTN
MAKRHIRLSALGTAASVITGTALAQPLMAHADATTISVDNLRSAWDSSEPGLNPATISSSTFGQIFSTAVDGQVYAQPIVAGNIVVVATENNNVYGLDPVTGAIAWQRNLGPAFKASAVSCGDLVPTIGVTSTPVYDPATGTVYLTSKTYSGGVDTAAHWYMYALDAATGQDRQNFPMEIKGSPDNDPTTEFDAFHQMQRPGLLLMNGVVYAGFGGHCDAVPYRGFVVGVDAADGHQTAMWTDEADGVSTGGGIWQAGSGLMSDGDGRIFFSTGNGMSPHASPDGGSGALPDNLGEAVVRLQVNPDKTLSTADYFSPANNASLDLGDTDLGSGGPVGLPEQYFTDASGRHLAIEQGKDGRVFVLDRDALGGMAQGPGGTDAVVSVSGPYSAQFGHPAVWGGDGGWVYAVGSEGPLRAFRYGASSGTPTLTSAGTTADKFGYTSGSPVVTSTGTTSGSAVVWIIDSPTGSTGVNAELRAYDAMPNPDGSMRELFSAPIGTASKFAVPATDRGRVYVGTRDGHVLGFGSPTTAPLTAPQTSFGRQAVHTTASGTVTLTATQALKVTGAKTSSAAFGVDTSGLAQPVSMAAGDTLTLPVTFTPAAPGTIGAILSVQTESDGTVGVSLTGTGTQDGLGSNPPALAFDTDQPVGFPATLPARIVNTGTTDETVGAITVPADGGPYTVTGLPDPGTVLAPGQGVDVSVTYHPTAAGASTDSIVIHSTSGNATNDTLTIPLSGTAVDGQGHLTFTPPVVDFGDVTVGKKSTQRLTVSNDGNIPLTITKAKAPAGVFSTAKPLNETMVIGPEQTVTLMIDFQPDTAGPASAFYEVTANTGQGAMTAQFIGNGVAAPPPPDGGSGGGGTTAPPPPAPTPAPAGGNPTVSRLWGDNRYLTGVAVSQAQWANAGGDNTGRAAAHGVVLARGDMFPDALAGVPLAAKLHGPLLLTDPKALTKATEDEIHRVLGTSGTVDILGGESAVSPAVESRLRTMGYTVNRYSGADRDATALDIARRGLGDPANVVLATGQDFADALAAGPFAAGPAAVNGTPAAILPTDGKTLDPRVAAYARSKAVGSTAAAPKVWAVGGQAGTASANLGGFVQVYAGTDRYETDAKLVRAAAAMGAGGGAVTRVGIATGTGFPDALTGGAYAANAGAQLVTIASTLDAQTLALLQQLQPALVSVSVFGGPNVISPSVVDQVTKAVKGKAG